MAIEIPFSWLDEAYNIRGPKLKFEELPGTSMTITRFIAVPWLTIYCNQVMRVRASVLIDHIFKQTANCKYKAPKLPKVLRPQVTG
jgi:hypothetical protein